MIVSPASRCAGPASHAVQLEPGENVRRDGASFVAQAETAWLQVRFAAGLPAGRWISLAYRGSYHDRLARPLLRFVTAGGHHDQLAPAPLFGRAAWIGRVPDDARALLIAPVDREGQFGFEVEHCRTLSRRALVARLWPRHPGRVLEAIGARLIGRRQEADRLLARALASTPFAHYDSWRRERWRDFDPDGLDAPRRDWSGGPHMRIIAGAATGQALQHVPALLEQLARQPYPRWSVAVVAPEAAGATALGAASASERLRLFAAHDAASALRDDLSTDDLVAAIDIGDILPPYALAVLAERAAAQPAATVFYGDDEAIDMAGRYVDPRLKPDWSPTFEAAGGYVGRALFVRSPWLTRLDAACAGDLVGADGLRAVLARAQAAEVEHIRRVLLTRRTARSDTEAPPGSPTPSVIPSEARDPGAGPAATIIIPNKDRADLLAACVRSLGLLAAPGGAGIEIEIVIVDNGSTEPKTRQLYATLTAQDARLRVLERPGPFNFALLCNEAARTARAPVLVFLNNDVEARDGLWLPRLLSWAARPDIGAVGARLLYPSGRLQHGGVVIGLGGVSGHVDSGVPGDDSGYLRRRAAPHEVAAVTAACLAVEKAKFDAVGGFDAEHLPVELNDIDLCLRLAERGWRTLLEPASMLVHHESASRGRTAAQDARYRHEREFFRNRWQGQLRDDRYFHPSLSLKSIWTALG